jgi:site-specific recombinase XerC
VPSRADLDDGDLPPPEWFAHFMADRAIRKPSPHTMKAYRQDFEAIALQLCGGPEAVVDLKPADLAKDAMRLAFASYAEGHAAASIRRCWSTWNTICTFLYTAELLAANPMPVSEWAERDRAIIFTALLAGLRSEELIGANVGDVRVTDEGAVIQVRGKGNKDRRIPLEHSLVDVITTYLASRAVRFPGSAKRRSEDHGPAAWPAPSPLFVGGDGQRITRGTLQYRVLRAFKKAGVDGQRARGVLVHGLRHTFATGLANENVSVYTLMKLLGHESMVTSQRYVDGAGAEHRVAAAQNPLYGLLE